MLDESRLKLYTIKIAHLMTPGLVYLAHGLDTEPEMGVFPRSARQLHGMVGAHVNASDIVH